MPLGFPARVISYHLSLSSLFLLKEFWNSWYQMDFLIWSSPTSELIWTTWVYSEVLFVFQIHVYNLSTFVGWSEDPSVRPVLSVMCWVVYQNQNQLKSLEKEEAAFSNLCNIFSQKAIYFHALLSEARGQGWALSKHKQQLLLESVIKKHGALVIEAYPLVFEHLQRLEIFFDHI